MMSWSDGGLLCEELIVEIFSRLPAKSVVRFRSVSKSLCGRISSPDFIWLHTLRSKKKKKTTTLIHRILYKGESETKGIYTIHSHSEGQRVSSYNGITPVKYPFAFGASVIGSCNGIVCLYEYERSWRGVIHLWNPSIRRKTTVGGGQLPPWGSRLAHGFGFDPLIDDYKILWTSTAGTFVYTLKSGTWRQIASPLSLRYSYYVNSPQCLFDGAFHWVVGAAIGSSFYHVLKFDLSSEVFSTIALPEPSWETNAVTVIKGCLAVICSKDGESRIWLRRRRDDSWSLANAHERQLATHGDLLFNHYTQGGMRVYNPDHETQEEEEWRLVNMTSCSYIVRMITGIETLGLLDMGTAALCDDDDDDVIKEAANHRAKKRSRAFIPSD